MTKDQINHFTEVVMDEWYAGSFTDRKVAKELINKLIRDVVDIEFGLEDYPEMFEGVLKMNWNER